MLAARYELHGLLGKGGMAEVYEASAHGAHGFVRRVAIKRLLPGTADESVVRMFFDEARIASRLHHAGIVAVLDYAVVDDAPFQVLELVDGWNASVLARQARERGTPMPLAVALHVCTETAHALAFAHEARDERGQLLGIVHRDVKPSNVLVTRGGDVKLGDFGIALARERASHTTGFVARGTPSFMSPEQLLGNAPVDARTDVFALGCTLHALVTGWSPLSHDGGRSAMMAGTKLPLAPELPPPVLAIVERAVSIAPAARYGSAREMAAALGAELARHLQTDAKTAMMQWLQTMMPPERSATTVMTSIVQAPVGTMTVFGGLTTPDRIFTTRGGPPGPAAPPLPPTMDATAPVQPRWSAPPAPTMSQPFGSSPGHATHAAPGYAPVGPAAPARDGRGMFFAIALGATLLLAVVAGGGIYIGHRLQSPSAVVDAGVGSAAKPGAAGVAVATADAGAAIATGTGTSRAPAGKGPPAAAPASPQSSSGKEPAGLAGTGAPVPDGCRCDALERGLVALCHPAATRPVTCRCEQQFGLASCFVPFRAAGQNATCPEERRALAATAKDGDACQSFPIKITRLPNGQLETSADTSTPGTLSACNRCATTRLYPRTQGAPCVGIAQSTGQRANGRIECL